MTALVWRSLIQGRLVLLGCIAVLTGLQVVIVGQASALEENNSFGRMAELVPGFLQRGLGSQALLLVSFKGTVAFGYFHPVVAAVISVLAVYFVTEPAYEVESGLVDLTLARSIPRHVIVTRSIVVAAVRDRCRDDHDGDRHCDWASIVRIRGVRSAHARHARPHAAPSCRGRGLFRRLRARGRQRRPAMEHGVHDWCTDGRRALSD